MPNERYRRTEETKEARRPACGSLPGPPGCVLHPGAAEADPQGAAHLGKGRRPLLHAKARGRTRRVPPCAGRRRGGGELMASHPTLTVISLGGGVQSSVMALMASESLPPTGSGGAFGPVPDCAIFAEVRWAYVRRYATRSRDNAGFTYQNASLPLLRIPVLPWQSRTIRSLLAHRRTARIVRFCRSHLGDYRLGP